MSHVATLLSRSGRGAKFGLERMRQAREALRFPDRALPIIHVAGTNGKGSVCAMVEAISRAAGLKTGLYTSPHLARLNERIRLDGEPIADELLEAVLGQVLHGDFPPLTFFEAMTLSAFVAMNQVDVDVAIIEVGLGGRLDATNVIEQPRVTAITSVALDHVNVLGDKLVDIAKEKAGIFKPGAPVVLGPLKPEVYQTIIAHAEATQTGTIRSARLDEGLRNSVALPGPHQIDNAGVAVEIARAFDQTRLTPFIAQGLQQARWPGRHEAIPFRERRVLLDCAHNNAAARALAQTLREEGHTEATLIFGALEDKDHVSMLSQLVPFTRQRLYCPPPVLMAGRQSVSFEELNQVATGTWCQSVRESIDQAVAASAPSDTILVTGSIFIVGAARSYLLGAECEEGVGL